MAIETVAGYYDPNVSGYPVVSRNTPLPVRVAGVYDAWALTSNVTAPEGDAILISATSASLVTLTLASGNTIVVNPGVGDSIYPFRVTKAVTSGGSISAYYNLAVAPSSS